MWPQAADDDCCLFGLRGLLLRNRLVNDAHDVRLLHDQEFLAINLDLVARPFAEQHAVADFDIEFTCCVTCWRSRAAGFLLTPTQRRGRLRVYNWYGGHEGHCADSVMKKILRRISLILA